MIYIHSQSKKKIREQARFDYADGMIDKMIDMLEEHYENHDLPPFLMYRIVKELLTFEDE